MPVPYQSIEAMLPFASPVRPSRGILSVDFASQAWLGYRRLRFHYPEIAELLEELYDRAAESCDQFVNLSEVNKYSTTCTVCRHFTTTGCSAQGTATDIIKLLHKTYQHDGLNS